MEETFSIILISKNVTKYLMKAQTMNGYQQYLRKKYLNHFINTEFQSGVQLNGGDLGCWDFSILDFRKIRIVRKGQNGPKLGNLTL